MKNKRKKAKKIWVVVEVYRGLPARVKAFDKRDNALRCEQTWRRNINLDYDDTGIFKVGIVH